VWRDLKLEWARELLRETDMTVDEVSRRVGFNSPFYFSTVFRQGIGISPTSWRRSVASD
jgi:AraC-like DNA-binding protein